MAAVNDSSRSMTAFEQNSTLVAVIEMSLSSWLVAGKLLARIVGLGVETADMLVHEILSRRLRDRRAVARYAGLTGAPDESGGRRLSIDPQNWL